MLFQTKSTLGRFDLGLGCAGLQPMDDLVTCGAHAVRLDPLPRRQVRLMVLRRPVTGAHRSIPNGGVERIEHVALRYAHRAQLINERGNERIVLPKSEIENRVKSNVSLMPDDQLTRMSLEEIQDLVSYLASNEQVPSSPSSATGR